jgi:hypothetical protein
LGHTARSTIAQVYSTSEVSMIRKITVAALALVLSSTSFVLTGCMQHHEDHPYGLRGDTDTRTYPEKAHDTRDMEKNQSWQHD